MSFFDKKTIWLACILIGPILAFLSVFYNAMIVLAIIVLIIGIKGVLVDIM